MKVREVALRIVSDILDQGAYAAIALNRQLAKQSLSVKERRLVTELVYGTVKAKGTLDWLIQQQLTRPLDKLPSIIRNILRLGYYQIYFLQTVAIQAACSTMVNLAKKHGHPGTVKLVNAVLRNGVRNKDVQPYPDAQQDPAGYLSLRHFHPRWLVERWLQRLTFSEVETLCEFDNAVPPLSLRVNFLRTNRVALLQELQGLGGECAPSPHVPEGILCTEMMSLHTLQPFQEGRCQVQDESSMLVAHVLDPQPGDFIIDACAAPGGKTTHLAERMENRGRIIANDIYDHKLKLIEENAQRLGIDIIETHCGDAALLNQHYAGQADRVLVDAPCSGLGVLRRRPDARWRKEEQMLAELPMLQLRILVAAAECVRPGGVLVYSTCTTEQEENDAVVQAFLQQMPQFRLDHAGEKLPMPRAEQTVQLWPHIDRTDGFYIARLIRKETPGDAQ